MVWVLLLAGVVSYVLTGFLRRYALSKSLLDIPNSRSSHSVPTPRSGGLAFVIAISLSVILFGLYYGVEKQTLEIYNVIIIGGTIIAALGLVDDLRHVPAIWRLLVHSIVASYAVVLLGIPVIEISVLTIKPNIILEILFVIGVIWLINLYNFMDGIDGLAGAETVCVTGGAALILLLGTGFFLQPDESMNITLLFIFLAIMISVSGFLIWNWPPAKIFMGDVGSSYLGFVFGVLVISTPLTSILTLWTWLILLGVFFADATTTLIIRMINGERWYTAHRTHAYQHAAQKLGSHRVVTVSVILVNILWLLPLAWFATMKPTWGALITLVAYIPLIILAMKLSAGKL